MTDEFDSGPVKSTQLLWEQVYNCLKERLVQRHIDFC